jgi:regulator of RNase E activity RraA
MPIPDARHPLSKTPIHENGGRGLPAETLEALRLFDTCTIANAIERFGVRLRNEGYTRFGLQCVTGGFPRVAGYAFTTRVRLSDPPMTGGAYMDRTDWWSDIKRLPVPRIAVIQDIDSEFGCASVAGRVHAAILRAFHCKAIITNGAVRHIEAVAAMEFPMFAHTVAVSHAYVHIVDYCRPVEIFGLRVQPGDLLFADCHGAISVPLEIAADVPRVAAEIRANERRIVDLCQTPGFSPDQLREALQDPH